MTMETGPKPAPIMIEIAPGELLDKISILEIKLLRLSDPGKLHNVRVELAMLERARDASLAVTPELEALCRRLRQVNEALWEIEDAIREEEHAARFGPRFIELARAVYRNNDERAAIKREINLLLGSTIVEEKSYSNYGSGDQPPAGRSQNAGNIVKIAIGIFRLLPRGGLEDHALRIADELARRGHEIVLHTTGKLPDVDLATVALDRRPKPLTNHGRMAAFAADFKRATHGRFDRIVGFQPMPGIDVLFLADHLRNRPDASLAEAPVATISCLCASRSRMLSRRIRRPW